MSQNTGHTGDEYTRFVVCNSSRSVSFAPRDFPALRRVFPRSEIFVCLRFISHIVDVESFLRFNNFEQRIFPRIFNVFSIILDYSRFYPLFTNHDRINFFSDETEK